MKKTGKSICILAVLALLCALLLSGCHGSSKSAAFDIPDSFDTSRHYELTFWAKNDTNKAQTNVYNQAISDFEELYPNISITIRLYTDYGKIYNDVITNISTNSTPNICITYPDHIATYMTGENTVVPLDDLLVNPSYGLGGSELLFDSPEYSEVVPEFLEECRLRGHYYAIPYMRSTEACYINKDFVEALGYEIPEMLTWDYIWEVSEAATEKQEDGNYKVNGQSVMIPFIYKSTDNMMISMLKQLDAGYSDDDGNILIFNDDTRNILKTVAQHVKTGAFSTFKISSYPGNFLNAGQCIFAIDSTAGASWLGADAPLTEISEDAKVDFETVVMPIPQYDTANPRMISQGPSICIFNKDDPQEVLASWLFAQFMLTNTVQNGYAKTEGYVPVTTKAQQSEEYQDYLSRSGEDNSTYYKVKIDAAKLLLENTQNTFVTPVFNGSTSLRNAAGELIEDVAKSVRRKKTVDDAYLDNLFDSVTSLYRLDQIETSDTADKDASVKDLGPLPSGSIWLISVLIAVWIVIGIIALAQKIRQSGIKKAG